MEEDPGARFDEEVLGDRRAAASVFRTVSGDRHGRWEKAVTLSCFGGQAS